LRTLQLEAIDKTILNTDLEILQALDAQIEKTNLEIAFITVDQDNVKLLMTLPGVDYYAAMVIASEIGDVHRFPDAKNQVTWTGLARSVDQSGGRTKRGPITRQGSRTLRWILIQATHNACRNDLRLRSLFQRVARRGIGGYLGQVMLQISFYDSQLRSTTTEPCSLELDINYSGYV
jgi:transposase